MFKNRQKKEVREDGAAHIAPWGCGHYEVIHLPAGMRRATVAKAKEVHARESCPLCARSSC
jgi:hypothetical protein